MNLCFLLFFVIVAAIQFSVSFKCYSLRSDVFQFNSISSQSIGRSLLFTSLINLVRKNYFSYRVRGYQLVHRIAWKKMTISWKIFANHTSWKIVLRGQSTIGQNWFFLLFCRARKNKLFDCLTHLKLSSVILRKSSFSAAYRIDLRRYMGMRTVRSGSSEQFRDSDVLFWSLEWHERAHDEPLNGNLDKLQLQLL